ncbi:MAG: MarR family winged helix-turn-helix transcriptional regulator [Nocardioidaceae bacterium]
MEKMPDHSLAWLELQQATSRLRTELSRRAEREAGMSATEHDVLWNLANDVDRRMTMSDIAERAMVTRSGATRLVERLERQGWVRRESVADNRRVTYAVLTADGVKAVRASAWSLHHAREELFDRRLTDTDVADLRRVLGKLLRRLDVAD